ncbi:hypothetical protein SCANM63S_10264 [Streptomyces canarius]
MWNRPELAARDRSLITVAALVAGGDADQLRFHLGRAKENGVTETKLIEAITHLAFYAGWPKATTAITTAKQVFAADTHQQCSDQIETIKTIMQTTRPLYHMEGFTNGSGCHF